MDISKRYEPPQNPLEQLICADPDTLLIRGEQGEMSSIYSLDGATGNLYQVTRLNEKAWVVSYVVNGNLIEFWLTSSEPISVNE